MVGVRHPIVTSSLLPDRLMPRHTLRQFQYRTFPTFQQRNSRLHVNAHDVWHPRKSIPTVRKCGEAACSNVTRSGRRLELRTVWGVRRAEDWLRGVDGELMVSYTGLDKWL